MQRRGAERDASNVVACLDVETPIPQETPRILKERLWWHKAKVHFHEYCENTSLHGLRYLGERQRPLSERLCWLALIISCIVICSLLIANLWHKWQTSPVIISFAETWTPVQEIPFPAVTICSEVKIKQTVFNFSAVLKNKNRTNDEDDLLEQLGVLCDSDYVEFDFKQMFASDNFTERITEVSPTFYEALQVCFWRGQYIPCSKAFTRLLTDQGLCYSFNTLPVAQMFRNGTFHGNERAVSYPDAEPDWRPDDGYYETADPIMSFPFRTNMAGSVGGLRVILHTNSDDVDPLCSWPAEGFKILLHNPAEFPQVTSQFFRVALNRDMVVGVKPNIMTTSPTLVNYSPERRKCFFSLERQLAFFAIYTQNNCELECQTNYTLEKCDCVAYYMPRKENTPVCGAGNIDCVHMIPAEMQFNRTATMACNCLPACTELSYDSETSQAGLDWRLLLRAHSDGANKTDSDISRKHFASVSIYFKQRQFMGRHRSELYGKTDFLANCGGLLGLYMGFSILSLAEIVYFLSVKLWCGNSNIGSYRLGWVVARWRAMSKKRSETSAPL